MAKGYIYVVRCPVTKKVAYVGKSHNPKNRFYQHRINPVSTIGKWIRAMVSMGWLPTLEIIDYASVGANQLEQKYIKEYYDKGEAIHNVMIVGVKNECRSIRPVIKKVDNCPNVIARKKELINNIIHVITYRPENLIHAIPVYALEKIYDLLW